MSTTDSSTEVAVTDGAQVPALPGMYRRPTTQAAPGERTIPIVYLMADLSRAVKSGIAKPGNVIAAVGPDDDDPYPLIENPDETFRAFIIDYHRYVTRGGGDDPWERLPNDYVRDPSNPADADVNIGYKYAIAVPDAGFPLYSLLLIRSAGLNARKKVNFVLDDAVVRDPDGTDPVMIEFGVKTANSNKGHTYWQYTAKAVEPTKDELEWVRPIASGYAASAAQQFQAQPSRPEVPESSGAGF